MYELHVERRFYAAHALKLYDGSWEPSHAHDWLVEVFITAQELDAIEVVMDFHELERILDRILSPLQGQDLNQHAAFAKVNPSAERVAEHIALRLLDQLPAVVRLSRVRVTEAPGCRASYLS